MRYVFSVAGFAGFDWVAGAEEEDAAGFVVVEMVTDEVVAVVVVVFCGADVVDEVVGFVATAGAVEVAVVDAFLFSLAFFGWVEEAGNFLLANCQLTSSIDTNFFSRSKYWL